MSAQAVISMIVSGLPDNPRGSSGGEGASGFRDLLDMLRSARGDADVESPGQHPVRAGAAQHKSADEGSGPLVLPAAAEAKAAQPQVLPGPSPTKGEEPLVVPGALDGKPVEPQILPDPPTKDAEPLVLPGSVVAKEQEPEGLPDTAPEKGPEPLVLPDGGAAKGLGPQVLPGAIGGKAARPQVLPGLDPAEVAPPVTAVDDAAEVAGGAVRPGAGHPQTHSLQPVPPPLRALAERTSKPLDEARTAPSPSATDAKTMVPTTSPATAPADQPAKPTPQVTQAPAVPQPDRPATAAPDEASAVASAAAGAHEAAPPARDHNLSTLSRASIDATAQIAAQIQRRLEGRSTRFEIALRPAELGRVDIKLDIDAEGRLAARLAFDNPAAATDLRGRVDDLRRQLEAAGFELADDAFEFAERDSGSSAFDRGQDARQGQNRAFAAAARLKTEVDVAQPPQWLALSLSPSGVDMKV